VDRFLTFRSDAKGRTVIPAALREQAGIRQGGDVLVGDIEDGARDRAQRSRPKRPGR